MAPRKDKKKFGSRHYEVRVAHQTHKCHIDQLRSRQVQSGNEEGEMMSEDFYLFPSPSPNVESNTERVRYPQRDRRPPNRLTY